MKFSDLLMTSAIAAALGVFPVKGSAQMLKDIVDAAPQEEPAPMPHVVPDDPSKMNIR